MAFILSLETSVDTCSVALHNEGELLAAQTIHEPQMHASKLAGLIEEVLNVASARTTSLQAVAITSGPGSYTGLRIGTSTAKGLCYALAVPLIALPTLELLAYQASHLTTSDTLLCPMIDARRMEVYCTIVDSLRNTVRPVAAEIIDEASFKDILPEKRITFFGNGSSKCKAVINHPNAIFIDGIIPAASSLGEVAFKKFTQNQFVDLVHFEPFYLKEFQVKKSTKPLF